MTKTIWVRSMLAAAGTMLLLANAGAAPKETRLFELRTYYAAPGKLENLKARFRDHTVALFEKHGISNVGYWLPLTNPEDKLVYLLAYPSREARETAWKEFAADPAWQAVVQESERAGKLVRKVESVFLTATDFSPAVKVERAGTPRLFELRIYRAAPEKMEELLARFRNHTTRLFARHGMQQIGYWVPTEKKDGAGDTLIYLLAHQDREAQEASFKAFRSDREWLQIKIESEANGPLTTKDGVQSVLLAPADFSPMQ